MNAVIARVQAAAKAVVAALTPLVVVFVSDALTELSTSQDAAVAAVATALLVYLVPNREE